MSDGDPYVARFLRDHYGTKAYALLVGEHTITNIPEQRLAFMIASILLYHAGGRHSAHAAVDDACDALSAIQGEEFTA